MAMSKEFDLVDSDDDSLSNCSICMEYFSEDKRIPKFLQCHHSFCILCIQAMVKTPQYTISCPFCREITIPSGGVEKLKTNPYALLCGNLARKKQEEFLNAPPILWCVRCGSPAVDDCGEFHLIMTVKQSDKKQLEKLHNYVSRCRENWIEAVQELRNMGSQLRLVVSSLKTLNDKADALVDENASQIAIAESLIDEVEVFGSDPTKGLDIIESMDRFRRTAKDSRDFLSEALNRAAELNVLESWNIGLASKSIPDYPTVPLQLSTSSKDPFNTAAAFAMTQLLPTILRNAATSGSSPGSQGANIQGPSRDHEGKFQEVGACKKKNRPDNYALAAAKGAANGTKPNTLQYNRNSCCFLDITINEKTVGRIIILLETDYAQIMCKAFLSACCPGNSISYLGTRIFQAVKDEYISGGSIEETKLENLYIPDKSTLKDERGVIRMRRRDSRDKQVMVGTEFSIILSKGPHRQYPITTVFGRVVDGLGFCDHLGTLNPFKNRIIITGCGRL